MGRVLSTNNLASSLARKPDTSYLVSGDESFLIEESTKKIIDAASSHGFVLGETFYLDNTFDEQEWLIAMYSGSLFEQKKLVKLIVPNEKPGKLLKPIQEYLDKQNSDRLLLIIFPKLSASTQKTKWFKELIANLAWLAVWPPHAKDFCKWLTDRSRQSQLNIELTALELLADYTQGNLALAVQTLTNLHYMCGDAKVTTNEVKLCIGDKSQYQVYELVDVVLTGNSVLAVKILERLRSIKQDAGHIINSLVIEVSKLSLIINRMHQDSLGLLFKQYGIYSTKQAVFNQAIKRHSVRSIDKVLQLLDIADQVLKGWLQLDIWYVVREIILVATDARYLSILLANSKGLTYAQR